jgi:hypothetical protein
VHFTGENWQDEQQASIIGTIHVIAERERNADRDANAVNHESEKSPHKEEGDYTLPLFVLLLLAVTVISGSGLLLLLLLSTCLLVMREFGDRIRS